MADLGTEDAIGALEVMNTAPGVTERADGYVQDLASQWVADAVGAAPGERVADLCAAPGGKATALAADRRDRDRGRHPQGPRRPHPRERPGAPRAGG